MRLTSASAAWYSAISASVPSGPTKVDPRSYAHLGGSAAQSGFVVGVTNVSRTYEPYLESL